MNKNSPEIAESPDCRERRPMISVAATAAAISASEIAAVVKPHACPAVTMAAIPAGLPSSCWQSPDVNYERQRTEDDRNFGEGNVGQNLFSVQTAMRIKTS